MISLLIGFLAGILSGLFGIGGGIVIVPGLILFGGLRPQVATGTSLAALLLPVGALGAWHYWRNGDVRIQTAMLIGVGLALGAWLGARMGVPLSPRVLQRSFAAFLVLVAAVTWARS